MGASRAGRANCDVNCAEYTSPNTYVAASHKIANKNRARCPLYGSGLAIYRARYGKKRVDYMYKKHVVL